MTAPLLAPGYLLLRDAVSTPRSYLSDAALGLTQAAPRALPQDFAIALGSQVLDGGVLVKLLLILGLWLAGWGAARLVAHVLPGTGLGGQFVAQVLERGQASGHERNAEALAAEAPGHALRHARPRAEDEDVRLGSHRT